MENPLRTYIDPDQELDAQERPGFIPVCRYGSLVPEKNEIGAIGEAIEGEPRYVAGVFVYQFRCLERIFLKD